MISKGHFDLYVAKLILWDLESQESIDLQCHKAKIDKKESIIVYFSKLENDAAYHFSWEIGSLPTDGDYFYRGIEIPLDFWLPWESNYFVNNLLEKIEGDDILCHCLLEEIWERFPQDDIDIDDLDED